MKRLNPAKKILLFLVLLFNGASGIHAAISGSTVVCANTSIMYSSSSYPLGYTYNWTVNGATQSVPNGQNIAVTWGIAGTGMVSLIVKDSYGVIVYTGSVSVTINPLPSPKIIPLNANGCSYPLPPRPGDGTLTIQPDSTDVCYIVCDSSLFSYSAAIPVSGHTYSWSVIPSNAALGLTVTGLGQIKIRWGLPANSPVSLKLYEKDNATGCSDTVQACIRIIARPNATFATFPAAVNNTINICKNATVAFIDQSTADPNSSIASWYWTFGDGTSSILQNPSHSYTATGTYVVKLLVKNQCHCRDSMRLTVKVESQSGPDITCISPVCYSASAKYCTSYTCSPYSWSVNNGTIVSGGGTNCIDVNWGGNGPGSITLQGTSCTGSCAYPTQVLVPILSSTMTIMGLGTTNIPNMPVTDCACENSTNVYSVTNVPGTIYNWSISTGTILTGQGTNVVSIFLPPAIQYVFLNLTYTNSFLNCSGVATRTIFVGKPIAISGQSVICLGSQPTLSMSPWVSQSFGSLSVVDPLGNSIWSGSTNGSFPNISFTTAGTYMYSIYFLGACNNAFNFPVQVMPLPPQPAVSINTVICPGQTVLYTAAPSSVNHFIHWAVTGGVPNQTSGNAISVTWNQTGPWTMTVTQQSTMPPSCTSVPLIFNMVNSAPPTPAISSASAACENTSITFSTSAVADSYNWAVLPANKGSIIPGTPGSSMVLQLNNGTAGTATVFLQIITCGSSATQSRVITITPMPTPTITVPSFICQNALNGYLGTSLGTSYAWTFGDGSQSIGQLASHGYTSPGNYTITLAVTNPGSCVGATSYGSRSITVIPAPIAGITSPNNLNGCSNGNSYTLFAIGQTMPGTPTYTWLPVSSSNYSVITPLSGVHSLTVSLNGCTAYTTVMVTTTNCPTSGSGTNTPCVFATPGTHQCYFTTSFGATCTDLYFNPVIIGSGGTVTNWEFGNPANSTSTISNPTFSYNSPGYYSVKLTCSWPAQNFGFCFKDTTIQVVLPMKARFNSYFSCGSGTGLITNFVDQSNYIPTTPISFWSWTINPGNYTSSSTNPSFNLAPGTYTAQLQITSVNSPITCNTTQTIVVPARPLASFTVPTSVCDATPFTFTATASPSTAVLSYLWSFGDGTSLFKSTPTITAVKAYPFVPLAPPYSSYLTITDVYNCTNNAGPTAITANQNKFTATNVTVTPLVSLVCQGDSVQLCAVSVGSVNPNTPFTYLWSNLKTSSCIYAKLSGPYAVTLTDAFGCKSPPKIGSLNSIYVPVPLISGERSYCLGEKPLLSIDRGTGYTYKWSYTNPTSYTTAACSSPLFPPASVCPPMSPSIAANYTGTMTLRGFITETVSGLNCSASGPSVNIVVHPLPASPVVLSNQCVQPTTLNLSATGTGTMSTLWNTGAQGSAISVNNPGKYWASVVDNFGCKSIADTAIVWPLPDFSPLVFGCYSICDTGSVTIPAPPGYAQYTWFKSGYGAIAGPSASPVNLVFNNPSTFPGGNAGTYSLALTSVNNCTSVSKPITIDIKPCRTCTMTATSTFVCNTNTNTGASYYTFTLNVNLGGGSAAFYALSSPNGTISNLSGFGGFNAGSNTVTGTFAPPSNTATASCMSFSLTFGDGSKCFWNKCFSLPPCNPPQCTIQPTLQITCLKVPANGNAVYSFNLGINYTGSGTATVNLASAQGNISPATTTISSGLNTISGTFEDVPVFDGTMCMDVYLATPASGWCQKQVCSPLQLVSPCFSVTPICTNITIDAPTFDCPKMNSLGQLEYDMSLDLNSSSGTYSYYLISGQGIVGPPSSTLVSPPVVTSTNTFLQTQPLLQGNNLCFTLVATNLSNGQICKKPFCVTINPCIPNSRLTSNVIVELYPNPTGDFTIAEYTLDNIEPMKSSGEGYNQINIIDLNGREVYNLTLEDTRGSVQINTSNLIPGIYFLRAMDKGQVLLVKKLIIQR